jgi:hypothetical protein
VLLPGRAASQIVRRKRICCATVLLPPFLLADKDGCIVNLNPDVRKWGTAGSAGFPSEGKADILVSMKSLLESNPYLADPVRRKAILRHNARQSSIFEGARGIPAQAAEPTFKRRSRASSRKAAKGR